MAFPPSSSSVLHEFTYDVFLSFNGEDTRLDFTSNLYKALCDSGIHAFFDDRELREGDEITPSHVKAIEESRIAIVVLSINYASSSFCLDELVHIIHYFKEKRRMLLPVFYEVDPSHVRLQTGSYGEAMAKHEERFQYNKENYMERLQKWKNALQQVANFPGFRSKFGNESEHTFIQGIVEEVFRKIKGGSLHVADYPVGLESPLKEVCSLLELESNGVLMVGIHGIDGIGKTTLARAVYDNIADQLFEGVCFLPDVRESSVKLGLPRLQEKLLFTTIGLDIDLGDVSEGILKIKEMLHQKKVLLILDDVVKLEQLEALVGGCDWFGSGSRVIITTRNKHLLTLHGIERIYEVQELSHGDALQLLRRRVSKQANVDPTYKELLNRAVTCASGLPLGLEKVGSDLFGKNKEEWKSTLDQYERIPHKLKTSFDALGKWEQSVFLDISCCFKGYELTEVQDILCGHYFVNMNDHIEVLIEKSFISISLDGKVTLPPLIEDMGKEIVRQESPTDPGRRSRLWNLEDIVQVLQENTGTYRIRIIHLDSTLIENKEVIEWKGEAFEKMEFLTTLIVRRCHFSRAPKHLPSSLRVLEWWGYPSPALPSDFKPRRIHICRISYRDPEVPPNSQGITEVSPSVPPPQTLDIVPYVPLNSQGVTEVPHCIPPPQTLDIVPYVPPKSQGVTEVSQSAPPPQNGILQSVYESRTTWIRVGLMSSVVGLPCYALSPSFTCLIGEWNAFKIILYVVFCLVILATICFEKLYPWLEGKLASLFNRLPWLKNFVNFMSSLFNGQPWLTIFGEFGRLCRNPLFKKFETFVQFMLISVYASHYDTCLDGKPEIFSMVSNAALILVSLSLSKLITRGRETGIFLYFLACFAIQLYNICRKLIFVAICFGCFLLYLMHSSSVS